MRDARKLLDLLRPDTAVALPARHARRRSAEPLGERLYVEPRSLTSPPEDLRPKRDVHVAITIQGGGSGRQRKRRRMMRRCASMARSSRESNGCGGSDR